MILYYLYNIKIVGEKMGVVKEVLFYCNVSTNKVSRMLPKIIKYYDLTFVFKGKLSYIIDGTQYDLGENDAIFLTPGTLRERLPTDQQTNYISFNFLLHDSLALDTFLADIINDDIKKLVSVFPQRHLTPTFHSKEKIESLLNYILYEIMDNSGFKSQNAHVIKMLKYIEAHIAHNLTLAEISDHVNLTKEYTANLFKKETGKTVIDYINERKMIIAKNMIDNGESSLQDIAGSLGFKNYSYFSKLFKKYYDTSPVKRKNA